MISGSNLNISTVNFKSNLTPADKTAKTNLANEQTQASKSKEEKDKFRYIKADLSRNLQTKLSRWTRARKAG